MYLIVVYDISTISKDGKKRLPKMMKILRQYLHHTQKSVFEGEITEAKYIYLQKQVKKLINQEEDYVIFFRIEHTKNVQRKIYGKKFDLTSNII